jgi:hypothetical protein
MRSHQLSAGSRTNDPGSVQIGAQPIPQATFSFHFATRAALAQPLLKPKQNQPLHCQPRSSKKIKEWS